MKSIVTLCSFLSALCGAPAVEEKPNILFICIDDLRPVLGCYGGGAKTPHIDRLAEGSVMFRRHYVQFPSCGPSRASMLSGRRPDSLGLYGNSGTDVATADPLQPTLPMFLKQHGYTTLSFGKVYHSKGAAPGCGWSEPPWHPPSWTCYVNFSERQRKKPDSGAWRPAMEIYEGPDAAHGDHQTADRVIAALRHHRDGPFFIAAGFYKPHLPFVAPKRFWDLYEGQDIAPLSPARRADGAADFGYAFREICSYGRADQTLFTPEKMPAGQEARDLVRAYYAAVSFTDSHVGRILAQLDELGLRETTAVVLWGDHGFHLGDQERWAKWTQFEADMHSPLMVRLPGKAPPGRATDALVESVDIYPTVAAIAGLAAPAHLEGTNLLQLIRGEVNGVKDCARSQVAGLQANGHLMAYSVRTDGHRYIEWRNRARQNEIVARELYDLAIAPHEMKNIASEPGQSAIVARHHQLIEGGYASLRAKPESRTNLPGDRPTRRERRALREGKGSPAATPDHAP